MDEDMKITPEEAITGTFLYFSNKNVDFEMINEYMYYVMECLYLNGYDCDLDNNYEDYLNVSKYYYFEDNYIFIKENVNISEIKIDEELVEAMMSNNVINYTNQSLKSKIGQRKHTK